MEMVSSMMDNILMVFDRAKENICMLMVINIKVTFKKIKNMV
jgi:hypothetical protein